MKNISTLFFLIFLINTTFGDSLYPRMYISLNGSHTSPFTNWTTASTNFYDAISLLSTNAYNSFIYVDKGRYGLNQGELVFRTNYVEIVSKYGPGETIIDAEGTPANTQRCIVVQRGYVIFDGFTFQNGLYTNGSPTATTMPGCFYAAFPETLHVRNSIMQNNYGILGGIAVQGEFKNCIARLNKSRSGGGAFSLQLTTLVTDNCLMDGNIAAIAANVGGGAVRFGVYKNTLCINNSLSLNNNDGGGMNSPANLTRNTIVFHNSGTRYGGGIGSPLGGSSYTVIDNNTSGLGAGGVDNASASTITNSIIYFNTKSLTTASNTSANITAGFTATINPIKIGDGNISPSNPKLINITNLEFGLRSDSPCRDVGTNIIINAILGGTTLTSSRDFYNSSRYGNTDMGAIEYKPALPIKVMRLVPRPQRAVWITRDPNIKFPGI